MLRQENQVKKAGGKERKKGFGSVFHILWFFFFSSCKRPDRLISKLKGLNLEGKKVIAIRAPKGPDGSKGFKAPRSVAVVSATA